MTFIDEVRVIHPTDIYPYGYPEDEPQRSDAQKVADTILATTSEKITQARQLLEEALDMFGVMKLSVHRDLPVRVGQFLDEVTETRRLRG